jgi:hypothetical protein
MGCFPSTLSCGASGNTGHKPDADGVHLIGRQVSRSISFSSCPGSGTRHVGPRRRSPSHFDAQF